MRNILKTLLALMLLISVAFSSGCSDKKNNSAPVVSSSDSSSSDSSSGDKESLKEGQSYKDCDLCNKTGKHCAAECDEGKCSHCDGEGKKVCGICNGENKCNVCDGEGVRPASNGKTRDCFGCDNGECSHCDDGYKVCSSCDGSTLCRTCKGEQKCARCNGEGKYIVEDKPNVTPNPSPDNNGSSGSGGYSDACPVCNDTGRMSCDNCFGYGSCIYCDGVGYFESYIGGKITKKDCSECLGGKCSTCHGTREVSCAVCR